MTNSQKEAIRTLRIQGQSYTQISAAVGLSVNTVKSCCRRDGINPNLCTNCGKALTGADKHPCKKFCCDRCRCEWWKCHRHLMDKKAFYCLRCIGCGKCFESYGNKGRKYCCHGCYIAHRFGKVEGVP